MARPKGSKNRPKTNNISRNIREILKKKSKYIDEMIIDRSGNKLYMSDLEIILKYIK
jgi:hypothetical protein